MLNLHIWSNLFYSDTFWPPRHHYCSLIQTRSHFSLTIFHAPGHDTQKTHPLLLQHFKANHSDK